MNLWLRIIRRQSLAMPCHVPRHRDCAMRGDKVFYRIIGIARLTLGDAFIPTRSLVLIPDDIRSVFTGKHLFTPQFQCHIDSRNDRKMSKNCGKFGYIRIIR